MFSLKAMILNSNPIILENGYDDIVDMTTGRPVITQNFYYFTASFYLSMKRKVRRLYTRKENESI
jgi:hypothetical protein